MNTHSFLTRRSGDLVAGAVGVVAAVAGVTHVEGALNDDWPILAIAGVVGVLVAIGALALLDHVPVVVRPPVAAQPIVPPAPPLAVVAPSTGHVANAGFNSFTLPKIGSTDEENEDSVAVNEPRRTIVISDGASSSFGAAVWSAALTRQIASCDAPLAPATIVQHAAAAAEQWRAHHTQGEVAWWAREGLQRGAFATLQAVAIHDTKGGTRWSAIGVGDSCVLHLRPTGDGWVLLKSFPVATAADFGSHPDLLSSVNVDAATFVSDGGTLATNDVLVVATDAVSEWLLTEPSRLARAAELPIEQLVREVESARHDRSMVNDDATFVRYRHT